MCELVFASHTLKNTVCLLSKNIDRILRAVVKYNVCSCRVFFM